MNPGPGQDFCVSRASISSIAVAVGMAAVTIVSARQLPALDVGVFGELSWRPLGGATLASADMLSVVTDTAFPMRVCGSVHPAGSICVSTEQPAPAWTGVSTGAFRVVVEGGTTVRPDPIDPDLIYGGNLTRYDRRTDQIVPIDPPADAGFRTLTAAPIVFGPDNKTLYYGANQIWKSVTAGDTWTTVSPDLTRGGGRDAIAAMTFSPIAPRTLWAGTSDGLLHVTRDAGLSWTHVTPPGTNAPSAIAGIETSHFDASSAYVVVASPLGAAAAAGDTPLWRTRDVGQNWTRLTQGLPSHGVRVVREDTLRRGLLFAGTDDGLVLSFDDGETWQPFRLNLPAVGIRDLTVRDADLLVATAGRGVWILRDISALRQATPDVLRSDLFLFRPAVAWRMRATVSEAPPAPLSPADLVAEPEPEHGVALHYLIGATPPPSVVLEILATSTGEVLRRFSSEADAGSDDWLDRSPGLHRTIWNLRYAAPPRPVITVAGVDEASVVRGVRVPAGTYQVRLTAGGRVLRQAVSVRLDPRVRASAADLAAHVTLSRSIDDKQRQVAAARRGLQGDTAEFTRTGALDAAARALGRVARTLQQFDGRPTPAVDAAAAAAIAQANAALSLGG